MTARSSKKRGGIVRYDSLNDMPAPKPLNKAFRDMGDDEVERHAAADPDAGAIPPGFWNKATVRTPQNKQQVNPAS